MNEKKTPSRITFGPDEIKKFEKHESSDETPETQFSMKPQFSNDRSPLPSIDPAFKNIPTQVKHSEIYSVNNTAPERTQPVPKSPSQKSPILFDSQVFTNEEAAPPPETYKKVVKTNASPSSSEPTQET